VRVLKFKDMHARLLRKLDFVLITNRKICEVDLTEIIKSAVEGGVGTVQLREKDLSTKDLYILAKELREITKKLNANLIINDRADIAQAVDADGVHLGWQSLNIDVVRKIIGQEKLIGVSTHNSKEAEKANFEGADYITISPVFDTSYKDYFIEPLGTKEIKKIKRQVNIPVIALGGINEDNIEEVMGNSADGIAVVSAVLLSKNPKQTATDLYKKIKNFKSELKAGIVIGEERCN
jgi:thiamine-phosphate pyrophosphorylase